MRTETFHTPGDVSLRMRIPAGSVDVETVDGEETRVELASEPGVEEAASIAHHGGEIVVEIEERRLLFVRTAPRARVRVTCPPGVRIVFEGISTDLAVRGVTGAVDARTVSGDVQVGRVEGDLELKSVSGDLFAGTVTGRATVKTTSGDVRVDDAGGAVTAQTVSGDQRFGSLFAGVVTLKSVSGDMHVGIRQGSRLWVDARSISGDTSSELELGDLPPEDDGPLVELRATAMSGDIRIVRA